jgi:hypothetical protein
VADPENPKQWAEWSEEEKSDWQDCRMQLGRDIKSLKDPRMEGFVKSLKRAQATLVRDDVTLEQVEDS